MLFFIILLATDDESLLATTQAHASTVLMIRHLTAQVNRVTVLVRTLLLERLFLLGELFLLLFYAAHALIDPGIRRSAGKGSARRVWIF